MDAEEPLFYLALQLLCLSDNDFCIRETVGNQTFERNGANKGIFD